MTISQAANQDQWDSFLASQKYSPFLQSWTMGEVYRDIGEEPLRLEMREGNELVGICQAIVVPAKRGRHLAVPYGPVVTESGKGKVENFLELLKQIALRNRCSFIRLSPFWTVTTSHIEGTKPSPLHLLAEHIWYLDLKGKTEDDLMKNMRQNHRNLIRRAQKEGVEVIASTNPTQDINEFFRLYDETRKRHHFVPYPNNFITSQLKHFSTRNECTLYLAKYQSEVIASSLHMHFGSETSYHHGASTHKYPKIPASYLLQWTAITDAMKRGDHMYNFWGIAPEEEKKHPFRGVTLFKTGFGGELLELQHCSDLPLKPSYHATRAFEMWRKWRRGF
ncbi:peptidoglycan bridge formation glycyltransferase FemA/FemB family protein [Patescibacteria group bacterium]|nr:peptidoglycan bridge formation glycyltransferase FemA/FemB family protein [Patescibacteria group bacterium]MBU2259453.1 peptidoglycan bridge formation glycyltransferase FemA/FemB family protein [Patescibacteria group bacterium]